MSDIPKPQTLSRRDFGRRAVATVAAAIVSVPLVTTSEAATSPTPVKETPKSNQDPVDAKLAEVIRKYGDRLSDTQRDRLRQILSDNQNTLKRVRQFKLENADAPATGLRLYPNDTQARSGRHASEKGNPTKRSRGGRSKPGEPA